MHIIPFTASAATDVTQAGGKGASLARLYQAGLPVPPGCVVSPGALTTYLEAQSQRGGRTVAELLDDGVPPSRLDSELREVLASLGPSPAGWAVRSSALAEDGASASYAGVYDSVLQVQQDELWDAIGACWRSWFSERALAYRRRLGHDSARPSMAVVVQRMVSSRVAGVAFTADPLHEDLTRMVIHASAGLGEGVVSGAVEPEQYTLEKAPEPRLLQTRLPSPQQPPLLDGASVASLGRVLLQVEELCGGPQDVEWAWDTQRYSIVQSRPITTLAPSASDAEPDIWTNANLRDILPGLISPLSWSCMRDEVEMAVRQQYSRLALRWPLERTVIRRFWGRMYFNRSVLQQANYEAFGRPDSRDWSEQMGGADIEGFAPNEPPSFRQLWRWLGNGWRIRRLHGGLPEQAPGRFAKVRQRWQEQLRQIPQLGRAAVARAVAKQVEDNVPFVLFHLDLTSACAERFFVLRHLTERYFPNAHRQLFADLVTGLGEVCSADQSYRLWALSRLARQIPQVMEFLAAPSQSEWRTAFAGTAFFEPWQAFLATYGHRAVYEVDLANPRWREQPDYLFQILSSYARMDRKEAPFDPQQQARRRQAAETRALKELPWWTRIRFRRALRRAQQLSRLREQSKSHLVQLVDSSRQLSLRAADLLLQRCVLAERDDVFMLERDELQAAVEGMMDPTELRRRIARRRTERQRNAARKAPEALRGDRPLYAEPLAGDGRELSGLPSSFGRVTATARVLRSPQEVGRLEPGEILVAPSTDPAWTPLFLLASGLVMESGGYLSHGAIVAREYGIPAVLNVPLATTQIPDGATITIDGSSGSVQLASA
jgi:pyruvate,water dikinase